MVQLGPDLLNDSRDVLAAHGGLNANEGTVLNNRRGAVESLGGGCVGTALLALLALLGGGQILVLTVLLTQKLGSLQAGIVDSTLGLSAQAGIGHKRALLDLVVGVEEQQQAVGATDLLEVSRVASLSENSLGLGLLALLVVTVVLGLSLLSLLLAELTLESLECLLLAEVVVLELANGGEGLLLLGMELGALVTEAGDVLVRLVLLGLDGVKLGLNLVVLLGEGLLLGVLHTVLDLLDLGTEFVNLALRVVELTKVLAGLAQAGDIGEGLLLVNELHGARVDLLLEGGNLAVDLLEGLEGNLGLGRLLLVDAASDLLIEALDLVELASTGVLTTGLLLTDLVCLGNELLSPLLGRALLVLVLVGAGNIDLGLDGVLEGARMSVNYIFFF